MTFTVNSYGVVSAKYETELVSQVNGEIVYLSDTFVKGGFVKKGTVLARIDSSDYDADLIEAQSRVASAHATLVQEKAFGKVAEAEWQRIENGEPTELSLRKPQLAQEIAKLNSSEASLKRAKRNVERTVIKAPYDALIAARNIGMGSYVSKGMALGKVLSTDTAEVRLPLADKEMRYLISKGKDAQVTLSAELAGEQQNWQAHIVRSEGVIDNQSRMTYLVAEINDPYRLEQQGNELRFGTYVSASILGADAGSVTVMPRHLVNNQQIAVLDDDNKLKYQQVNVIRQFGAEVVISSGLEPGMKVITSALDYPVEGMQLALPSSISTEPEVTDTKTELAMEDKE